MLTDVRETNKNDNDCINKVLMFCMKNIYFIIGGMIRKYKYKNMKSK